MMFSKLKKIGLAITIGTLLFNVQEIKAADPDQPKKITGGLSGGVFNQYVFRGYELSSDSLVIQPSITLSYGGFSVNYWGNLDTHENPTQSFNPDRPNKKSFNEHDITVSYTYTRNKLSLTGGYIYYGTKYTEETEEIFLSASYDMFIKPTITIYRDIATYPGTYVNFSLSYTKNLYKNINLDLAAGFGYFKGDSNYWRTYEKSTHDYTGKKYTGFHDGKIQAIVSIPLTKNFMIQPTVQYWFPLSSKAQKKVEGKSYNPNGHLDNTWVAGVNFTLNF